MQGRVPGGGWAFDARQVSFNYTFTFTPYAWILIELLQGLFPVVPGQPQTIPVTRGDLFGNQLLPGLQATDVWGLSLQRFRHSPEIVRVSHLLCRGFIRCKSFQLLNSRTKPLIQ